MHLIAVANRKGGVGKSSVATHLAAALGIRGWRVLVVDMDSQASTTSMLLDEVADDAPTTAQLLLGEARLEDIVRPANRDGLFVAPAASDLTQAQFAIAGKTGRETILRRAMRDLDGFDLVVIDTAPELQLATLNALVAASHVLMPFTPDPKALEGLETTSQAVAEIAARRAGATEHPRLRPGRLRPAPRGHRAVARAGRGRLRTAAPGDPHSRQQRLHRLPGLAP